MTGQDAGQPRGTTFDAIAACHLAHFYEDGLCAECTDTAIDAAVTEAVKDWKEAAATETPSGLATRIADLEANIRRRNRD